MEGATNNWFSNKYSIGYALSGGFIKGFAHLGAMQALLEHDIKPNIISGVSAGALAGVFYADGNEPHKVLDYFAGHKFQDLTKLVIPKVGLFELSEFKDFLKSNLKAKKLEELQLPLIITATDLDHGRLAHFHKGDIAERVAASCCMPVLFAPVKIDETYYVDGGLLMNLPVSTIRRVCEKVVAINVSPLMAPKYKMNIVRQHLQNEYCKCCLTFVQLHVPLQFISRTGKSRPVDRALQPGRLQQQGIGKGRGDIYARI